MVVCFRADERRQRLADGPESASLPLLPSYPRPPATPNVHGPCPPTARTMLPVSLNRVHPPRASQWLRAGGKEGM